VNNPAFNVLGSYVGCPAGTWVTSITKGPTTALSGGTTLSAISQLGCAAPATAIAQRYDQCYEEPFPTYNADHLSNIGVVDANDVFYCKKHGYYIAGYNMVP
jgi:hypothetical protein